MRPYKIKHLAIMFTSSKCCRCWKMEDFRCFVRYFLEVLLGHPQWHMARGNFQNSQVRAATRKWFVIMVFCLSPDWGCSPAKRPKFPLLNHLLPGMIHQEFHQFAGLHDLETTPSQPCLLSLICSSSYSSTKDIRFDTRVAEGDDAK